MIERNTMSYGSDTFQFRRQALLKTTAPFDLTRETSCTGFNISVVQPADTNIRIIFEVDDKLYYFTNDGVTRYKYHGELADILENGNTVAELLDVEGIVQWIGKKVYPIIALDAPRDSEIMPKIKLGLKVNCFNDEYGRDFISPIYELKHNENPARITAATYNKADNGYAKSSCTIRLRDKGGDWTDWLEFTDAVNKEACAVQFKAHYVLTTLDGSDEGKIFDCKVAYVTDCENLAGDTLEIFTTPQTYSYGNLGTCYALIKHTELFDADVKAYVKFDSPTSQRENINIGRGTGTYQTYHLGINGGIDRNINQSTLHITAGDINITDFYYNTENATVEVKAVEGVDIKASYEYDVDAENWVEMARQITQPYGDAGLYMSRFVYRTDSENKNISAVKFTLTRQNGTVDDVIGLGTGRLQTFVLPHRAKVESITFKGAWTYDEDTQILQTTADVDGTLEISYDWAGILPKVESFSVGWTPAI